MNANAPLRMSPSIACRRPLMHGAFLSLLSLSCVPGFAFETPVAGPLAAASPGTAYVPEVSTTSLPRFDAVDGGLRASRVDLSLVPAGRSGLGLVMGLTTLQANAPVSAGFNATQDVDLGLRWRHTLDSNYRIDVTAWRRVTPDAATMIIMRQPSYGARVEMQLAGLPRSGFVAERGFVGIQLEGGGRITLRRSGGKPMLYYRTKF